MKLNDYQMILILPPIFGIAVPLFIVLVIISLVLNRDRRERLQRFALSYVFREIFKEEQKTDGSRETTFLFKGIDLVADRETLSKFLQAFFVLLFTFAINVSTLFWQLLLLDLSYSCNEDYSKECFELNPKHEQDESLPVNCSSAAVQNGSIQVVCYKLVFNPAVAIGTTYGTFKLNLFATNVVTSIILKAKTEMSLKRIQYATLIVPLLVTVVTFLIVFHVIPIAVLSDNWVSYIQMISVMSSSCTLIFYPPWRKLIRPEPNESNDGGETGMAETTPLLS